MSLLFQIERAIRRYGIAASTFGRAAVGDPRLVFELRRGREVRPATKEKVLAYISKIEKENC